MRFIYNQITLGDGGIMVVSPGVIVSDVVPVLLPVPVAMLAEVTCLQPGTWSICGMRRNPN